MILKSLVEYYDRKAASDGSGIARPGWERKSIHYIVSLDRDGRLVNVESTLDAEGVGAKKKMVAKTFLVPRSVKRCGVRACKNVNFLWDSREYIVGGAEDDAKTTAKHREWIGFVDGLHGEHPDSPTITAIWRFTHSLDLSDEATARAFAECTRHNPAPNVMFRVAGDLAFDRTDVKDAYAARSGTYGSGAEDERGMCFGRCLVTGRVGRISRLHHDVPISQSARSLVGFQIGSGYDTYGATQGFNAPVCEESEFKYTTALNSLLSAKSRQKVDIGGTKFVFWTSKDSPFEDDAADLFSDPPSDDPDRYTNAVSAMLNSFRSGAYAADDGNTVFNLLALAPNSHRISVKAWSSGTVAEIAGKVVKWFDDLSIAHKPWMKPHLSMSALLCSIAEPRCRKKEDALASIPANVKARMIRSVLDGSPLPDAILQTTLRRIGAELGNVSYERAKLLKAYLNRKADSEKGAADDCENNTKGTRKMEVELDTENRNVGYLLGRLFAVLEHTQVAANKGRPLNATIRDRYYGSFSTSPSVTFGTLMRLKNHHLSNVSAPAYFERMIGEIVGLVKSVPPHLGLDDQARFALGYYHQRESLFNPKAPNETPDAESDAAKEQED